MKTLPALLLGAALAATGLSAQARPLAVIDTNMGEIRIDLDRQHAPKSVANFVDYARSGFYDGTVFHRVIDGFMIQGGGFDAAMVQKSTAKAINNEADNGLKNRRYTVAMARTMQPHSATSQFFINVADNEFLDHRGKTPQDWGYAVFGKVVAGKAVVDTIAKVRTGNHGFHQNVPQRPVLIRSVRIID